MSSGATARLRFTVTDDDTALAVGSGSLPVLGTPRLLAWCEAATCAALDPSLDDGATSVGTRVQVEHSAASPVGALVEIEATRTFVDGRLHRFSIAARDVEHDHAQPGRLLATGEITRVVVDAERFLARLVR
ncbi:thioesterase family protein [Nocardioides sp. R-C-SC26]|uniref:thioesterase family protein n=1 Tax=Nocardioides sp. R-C-SC26 TaxID=2870414 RepID=UPI001E57D1ED|nr:thioesterase [Nocardioides sp. R-C-SC26]